MKNELEEILIQKKKCKFLLHVLNKPKIVSKPKIHVDQNSLPSSNSSPLPVNKSVEVKLPNLAESFGQKFYTLFFYRNLYLHFLRPCCENIFNIVVQFQRKIGNLMLCQRMCYNYTCFIARQTELPRNYLNQHARDTILWWCQVSHLMALLNTGEVFANKTVCDVSWNGSTLSFGNHLTAISLHMPAHTSTTPIHYTCSTHPWCMFQGCSSHMTTHTSATPNSVCKHTIIYPLTRACRSIQIRLGTISPW